MNLFSARRQLKRDPLDSGITLRPMRRPVGLTLLTAFFVFGALMAFLAFLGLLFPGRFLESIWRANPQAQVALTELGGWGVLLMLLVALACALARAPRRMRSNSDWMSALSNKRLKLTARVDYGMNLSSARRSLSAIR